MVAQRLLVDNVRSLAGMTMEDITEELLLSAAGAMQKYCGNLDEEKRKKEQQAVDLKKKAFTYEVDVVKK